MSTVNAFNNFNYTECPNLCTFAKFGLESFRLNVKENTILTFNLPFGFDL